MGSRLALGFFRLGCADPRDGWVSKWCITIPLARCSLETKGLETFYLRVVELLERYYCRRTSTVQLLDSRTGLHHLLSEVGILSLMGK